MDKIESRLLTDEEIREANKRIYGAIDVLCMPQPEDYEVAKAQDAKTASILQAEKGQLLVCIEDLKRQLRELKAEMDALTEQVWDAY